MAEADAGTALSVVQKRIRAARKKLTRIQELEALQASGKELSPDQLPTLKSKPVVVGILDELQKVDEGLKELLKGELAAAYSKGHAAGVADGHAEAAEQSEAQLAELRDSHEAQLAELREELAAAQESALQQAAAEWQAQVDAANAAKAEVQAEADAAQAALRKHESELHAPLSPAHPLKAMLEEQLRKLLQLLYFSQLFDHNRNWGAHLEGLACLGYDQLAKTKEGEAALCDQDLLNLAYFGRTLVDRMNTPVSHQQHLDTALATAMKWLMEPQAMAIQSPPAPAAITMGELAGRVARILASEFCHVVPPDPSANLPPATSPAPGFPAPLPAGAPPAVAAPGAAPEAKASPPLGGQRGMDSGKDAGMASGAAATPFAPLPGVHPSSKVLSAARRDNSPVPSHHGHVGSAGAGLPGAAPQGAPGSMISRVLSSAAAKSASPTPPLSGPAGAAVVHTAGGGKVQLPAGILDDGAVGAQGVMGHQQGGGSTYPHMAPHADQHAFRARPAQAAPRMPVPASQMAMGQWMLSETGTPVPYDMPAASVPPGGVPSHLLQPGAQDGLLGFH